VLRRDTRLLRCPVCKRLAEVTRTAEDCGRSACRNARLSAEAEKRMRVRNQNWMAANAPRTDQ
jgi:hypothetical protein